MLQGRVVSKPATAQKESVGPDLLLAHGVSSGSASVAISEFANIESDETGPVVVVPGNALDCDAYQAKNALTDRRMLNKRPQVYG